jgi:hypothetical protein
MIYKIKISEDAELDLDEAYQWYESQISQLGSEFIRVVEKTFIAIALSTHLHPKERSPNQFQFYLNTY